MSANVTENQSKTSFHDDKDLVQLSGYHAYRGYYRGDEIEVNGKVFFVEDVVSDSSTGFEALVVRNITRLTEGEPRNLEGELIVIYVGSRPEFKDWETNASILRDEEPEQLKQAVEYFEKMEGEFGKISSVTGNSLGGALANRVAIDHPHVNSVTLNPAILPSELIDTNKDYSNITNYQSENDLLTAVQAATRLDEHLPGNTYKINSGLPTNDASLSNHMGYGRQDADGNFTFEVGTEGDPGHGHIHIGADDHIVTGIWNGRPLHGDSNDSIKLNVTDINVLADGLKNNVVARLMLSGKYIENGKEIVDDQSEMFEPRISELQEKLNNLLDEYIADPLYKGASTVGNAVTSAINGIISMLNYAEEKL